MGVRRSMMHMEHRMVQTQSQRLMLTQKMQQALQILQYNAQELDMHIQNELEINPVLEQGDHAESRAREENIDWPLATTSLRNNSSPYVPTDKHERKTVFMIGRSGELAWRGNPLVERRAFYSPRTGCTLR